MPTAKILYHSRAQHHLGMDAIVISIDGKRWEYWLNVRAADTVEYLARKVSTRKALAFAKRRAISEIRL